MPEFKKREDGKFLLEENSALQKRLVMKFGLTLKQANSSLKKYPKAYIEESLTIVEFKRKERVIKNIPAYTLAVLKNDYETLQNSKSKSLLSSTH